MNNVNGNDSEQWWQSALGQHLLAAEQELLSQLQHPLRGYFTLQLGGSERCLPESIRAEQFCLISDRGDVAAKPEALPFKSHSIDNMLLLHVLERSPDPHQLLRETERVLAVDGRLILCCFNPLSLWGLRRLFSWQDKTPWDGQFFTQTRITDWLALLSFDVIEQHKIVFKPPFSQSGWLGRSEFMERWGRRLWPWFGGVSVMVASKRTIPLTPIRTQWRKRRLFPSAGLVNKPLTREKTDGSR
jgi:SAM-dependent methyltransferase